MLHNAGAANAHVDHGFRLGYAQKGTGHKGVIGHSVAEHNQLRTANCITVRSALGRSLNNLAHLLYCIHINAAFSGAHAHGGAHNVGHGQCFRNGGNQIAVTLGIAFIYQCREAADKVNAHLLASSIQGLGQRHIIVSVAAFAHHGNRGYANALIDNGHAHFHLNILAGFNQLFGLGANFIINLLRRNLNIGMAAITQANTHGDGAHIQIIFGNHARGL